MKNSLGNPKKRLELQKFPKNLKKRPKKFLMKITLSKFWGKKLAPKDKNSIFAFKMARKRFSDSILGPDGEARLLWNEN